MKRYTVSEARMRMAEMLDSAESGESVLIERKGVRFQILPAPRSGRQPAKKKARVIEILDPTVERGDWTWEYGPRGLQFKPGAGR